MARTTALVVISGSVGKGQHTVASIGSQSSGLVAIDELGSEQPRLLIGALGKVLTTYTVGKPEIVADQGCRARLATNRLTFEQGRL